MSMVTVGSIVKTCEGYGDEALVSSMLETFSKPEWNKEDLVEVVMTSSSLRVSSVKGLSTLVDFYIPDSAADQWLKLHDVIVSDTTILTSVWGHILKRYTAVKSKHYSIKGFKS